MAPDAAQAWLDDASSLPKTLVSRANPLFLKHSMDAPLLDFLTSDEGRQLLEAWHQHRLVEKEADADADADADNNGSVDGSMASTNSKVPKHPRQKIPQEHRQQNRFYYAAAQQVSTSPSPTPTPTPTSTPTPTGKVSSSQGQKSLDSWSRGVPTPTPKGSSQGPRSLDSWNSGVPTSTPKALTPSSTARRSVSGVSVEPTMAPLSDRGTIKSGKCHTEGYEAGGKVYEGRIKSFSQQKGFGFIVSPEIDSDVFVRSHDICGVENVAASLCSGRRVTFQLYRSGEKCQARSVKYLPPPSKRFIGTLKTLGETYGFVECQETYGLYGLDVWLDAEKLPVELVSDALQPISFKIVHNTKGQPQAEDVRVEPTGDETSFESEASVVSLVSTSTAGRVNRW